MGLPYSVGTDISNALKLPKELFWHALTALTEGNGLLFALNGCQSHYNKFNVMRAHLILNHVIFRTFQFDKVLEFISHKDIIEGRPDICLPGYDRSRSSIKRAFNGLPGGLLLKLYVTQNGHGLKTPIRGFNLPALMQLVEAWMYAAINTRGADKDADSKPSILMLKTMYLLEQLNDLLSHYEKTFNFLLKYKKPIEFEKLDKFLKQLKKHLPSGRDYQESKENVIEAKRHLKERKLRKWYSEKINIDYDVNP